MMWLGPHSHRLRNHYVPVQWLSDRDLISATLILLHVSTWNNLNAPLSSSDIHLKLDNPIDLTGHILSPFFVREFVYQGCQFHSVAHLICYHYAVLHGLKTFANGIRKWVKHLTDFPTPRFQMPDWQVQCRSVLKEIYSHLWQLRQH